MIASRLNMISGPPPPPSSATETEKCRFWSFFPFQRVFAALSRVKYYSLRYVRRSVSKRLKLDLMDTCCGYYSAVLDSLDEGKFIL